MSACTRLGPLQHETPFTQACEEGKRSVWLANGTVTSTGGYALKHTSLACKGKGMGILQASDFSHPPSLLNSFLSPVLPKPSPTTPHPGKATLQALCKGTCSGTVVLCLCPGQYQQILTDHKQEMKFNACLHWGKNPHPLFESL